MEFKGKVVVTGSAGFIGSHLADYLYDQGYEVWGCDDLSIGDSENISPELMKTFRVIDLKSKARITPFIERIEPDVVFHAAAWAHEGLSQFCPRLITENGINAFLNVLIPAVNSGMKRFVTFSSMAVYGNQEPPFTEDMERKPEDIYAINKASMERMTEILAEVHGFEYSIVRPYNVVGVRQNLGDPYRNVVGIFMNKILKNEPYYIYGDGEQTRAFSPIENIIPIIAECGFAPEAEGEIFNVGSSEEYSINELSDILLEIADKDIDIKHVEDRPQEVKHAYCSNKKAKEVLGLEENMSLKECLKDMWGWALRRGPQKEQYLEQIELETESLPSTWKEKKI